MDTFVDSSWYFLRYASPNFQDGPFDPDVLNLWNPVDQYTGGVEHAVMHLLYARFFVKALRDLGMLNFDEPFVRLLNQGTILHNGQKMSKSRGNVIAPDDYVGDLGSDVVRTYLMFMGPWERGGDWSDGGINGVARWTNRVWDICNRDPRILDDLPTDADAVRDLRRDLHKTIRRVGEDIESFKFNTAIAAMMEFSNALNQAWERKDIDSDVWNESLKTLALMMSPITPFLSEELWERLGHEYSVHQQNWPAWDPDLAADEMITLVVQVNGRLRDRIQAPADISESRRPRKGPGLRPRRRPHRRQNHPPRNLRPPAASSTSSPPSAARSPRLRDGPKILAHRVIERSHSCPAPSRYRIASRLLP